MNDWCIQGWRQQSTDRDQILVWLAQAKQLGFERYNLFKQGDCYWLCCAAEQRFDVVAAVRSQIPESAAVVIQQWAQQLIVVAWQQQTLLGSCQFSADKHGIQNFAYVAKHWLSPQHMNCVLVIAGSATRRLFDDCELVQHAKVVTELSFEKPSKLTKMRSLRQSPPWLRQRVLLRGLVITTMVTLLSAWWFWPQPPMAPTPVLAATELSQPMVVEGWQPEQIAHVNTLLSQISFLAGWRAIEWRLTADSEVIQLQQTYGSKADLLAQLPSQDWQFTPGANALELTRQPPSLTTADITDNAATKATDSTNSVIDQGVANAGFEISTNAAAIRIEHRQFDPFSTHQWQAVLDWLTARPQVRITAISATPAHLSWRLTITVQQP